MTNRDDQDYSNLHSRLQFDLHESTFSIRTLSSMTFAHQIFHLLGSVFDLDRSRRVVERSTTADDRRETVGDRTTSRRRLSVASWKSRYTTAMVNNYITAYIARPSRVPRAFRDTLRFPNAHLELAEIPPFSLLTRAILLRVGTKRSLREIASALQDTRHSRRDTAAAVSFTALCKFIYFFSFLFLNRRKRAIRER